MLVKDIRVVLLFGVIRILICRVSCNMPLTELVRMFKGKVDEGASTSSEPSSRPDSDCVELVWENGQIMMQGKARKSSNSNNSQTVGLRPEDSRNNGNCSKVTKFSTLDSVMPDFSMPAPSCEMSVDQDVDLVPWLNYPMEEPLHNDYTYDFLNELSGVTINDLPAVNQLGYCERKGGFQGDSGHDSSVSLKHGITSKVSSSSEKDNRGESSEVPQFLLPFQHSVPRSGISDTSGNSGNAHYVGSRDSTMNPSSLSAFTSLRLQKLDAGARQPSTSSGLTNFPSSSWSAALSRASHGTVNPSNKLENDDKRCIPSSSNQDNSTLVNLDSGCSQKEIFAHNQSIGASAIGNSEALPTKPADELLSAKQPLLREDVAKNQWSQNQACDASMSKVSASGDRNMEPVIATSSVCSANSAERGSDKPARDLKGKSLETTESSGPSEEVEEESVGAKKHVSARVSSKGSRAAEVHNLSERRRRDRINEKMHALQKLIPNCNKADKASMLDQAIEYLKSLQLQVQMLSMGSGVYMQPMMLPPGMQPIHGVHMPHYAPMGLGMGMGMGFGMNMLNMNNGVRMLPFQGPHYPVPGTGPPIPGMPGSSLQAFPHPGQGLPISMQQAPVVTAPMSASLLKMPMGSYGPRVASASNASHSAPLNEKNDSNSQAIPSSVASYCLNQATNQVSNERIQPSALCLDQPQGVNPSENTTESAKGKDAMLT